MQPITHVIGAGLAGLSAALRLTEAGHRVVIYEAGPQAGGRCRSYFDEPLGCRIDNGNHLLMSGNDAALSYLKLIGAEDTLEGPASGRYPFFDRGTGERWNLAPNRGKLPWWVLVPGRRVPGSRAGDYLAALRFRKCGPDATVADLVGQDTRLYRRFWEPLAVAALNTEAKTAAAHLLWPVLEETFARGADFSRPLVARDGLSESFVDPALAWLEQRGATLRLSTRVRKIGFHGDRVVSLDLGSDFVGLDQGDNLVVAVPPAVATGLVPHLVTPTEFRPIVNAHFRLDERDAVPGVEILGVIGGTAEWIFRRGPLASVTISAASHVVDEDADALAPRIWADVAAGLALGERPMPAWRIVKEKRATFAETPDQVKRRPEAKTFWRNLALAGDWTDTGLPATIEGAIRSGEKAAAQLRST
ncbi:amine oxidase [Aliidongia dinghuensis]|uniref:Amine oxidase n=1 Tax=Aliidongia dinghuensis TaxID=1867774 RepID=A0A8J2YY55_9PROT|nr:hydroxysqualene dehydroxylase HpnE [Aliidongia dinghuensis]GGF37030.1 amine oxidase [Aliidongia dinghuensis]